MRIMVKAIGPELDFEFWAGGLLDKKLLQIKNGLNKSDQGSSLTGDRFWYSIQITSAHIV
jgi:hypothetical protein